MEKGFLRRENCNPLNSDPLNSEGMHLNSFGNKLVALHAILVGYYFLA